MPQRSLPLLAIALFAASAAWTPAAQALPEVPAGAHLSSAVHQGDGRVEARLFVDAASVAPGERVRVGVHFTMDPGWHIYWLNPGQAGLSTEIGWSGEGLTFDALRWPAPEVFAEADGFIITNGYADEVLLFSEATVGPGEVGAVELAAAFDFLVCEHICIPGNGRLTRALPVGESVPPDAETRALFDGWAARVPRTPAEAGIDLEVVLSQSAIRPNDSFQVALGAVTCAGPPAEGEVCRTLVPPAELRDAFVAGLIDSVTLEPAGAADHPAAYTGTVLTLSGQADADDPGGEQRLTGVLRLHDEAGQPVALAVDAPLPRAPLGADVSAVESPLLGGAVAAPPVDGGNSPSVPALSLWQAILFGLLGGIILNVMPCVFPVLSLKVFAFVKVAHHGHAHRARYALAYTLGILVSFWVLAAVIIAIRAGGEAVGQGFQFQHPAFVVIVGAVLVVFALNLFGVFEVAVGASGLGRLADEATGARRSFFEGILAVILATPCTAPFLGAASGFALAAPPATTIAVFSAIGVGLAAPFVLLVMIPRLARLLPKPGAWMVRFKQLMGFALLGTVLWLVWIIGEFWELPGAIHFAAFLLVVALATWILGSAQQARGAAGRRVGALLAVAIAGLGLWKQLTWEPPIEVIAWQPWTQEAVHTALSDGRPALIDFTAAWCTNCKINEELVLESESVLAALQEHDVATFQADWTRPDERISRELAAFGRGGVPMVLVYSPARPDQPVLLPEILTIDRVVEVLRRAAEPDPG